MDVHVFDSTASHGFDTSQRHLHNMCTFHHWVFIYENKACESIYPENEDYDIAHCCFREVCEKSRRTLDNSPTPTIVLSTNPLSQLSLPPSS